MQQQSVVDNSFDFSSTLAILWIKETPKSIRAKQLNSARGLILAFFST